jgi:hypothetical protein
MDGSNTLSDDEKREMLEDMKDVQRANVFRAARLKSQEGSMDEYTDFLSENIEFIE